MKKNFFLTISIIVFVFACFYQVKYKQQTRLYPEKRRCVVIKKDYPLTKIKNLKNQQTATIIAVLTKRFSDEKFILQSLTDLAGVKVRNNDYKNFKPVAKNNLIQISGKAKVINNELLFTDIVSQELCGRQALPRAKKISFPLDEILRKKYQNIRVQTTNKLRVSNLNYYKQTRSITLSANESMFERDNINNKEFYDNLIKLKFTYLNKMENQAGYIRLFDEIDFIDGVFYKKNNNYYITPIDKIKIKPVIKRKKQEEPKKDELKISFFNVENLFVKQSKKHYFENKAQIDFKLKKVAKAIYSNKPDLIALSELGNLTKEKYAIKKLVLELNKMEGKNKYSFFYDEKFNPKDRFYLAYIYDLKKFKPLDKPIASKEYSSITASFKNLKNGEKFVFSALHLRSPICDFNDISKGYGCFEELRQDQINQAFQNIKKITQKQNIKNILISGDFNSIINSKTYDYVKNKGFIDLLSAFEKQELLFSKFFNNSKVGLIDHFFANKTFFEKVKRAKIEHINSIEPQANNYKSLEDISLYRSSDHDIVSIFIKD